MRIAGSVAIVTGASSGIGAAIARELANRGATVVLAARRGGRLREGAAEIERRGGRALAVAADVRQRPDVDRLVAATLEAFGRVDVLVNNAGIGGGSSLFDDDESMQAVVETNLLAPARLAQVVAPHMRQQGGGVIVNIGSVAGEVGVSGLYSGSKFGLRGLSDAIRRELRQDGIAVVLVEPGFIRSAMTHGRVLPMPMPGPDVVSRAVAHSIERPRRTVVVPGYYIPPMLVAKLLPELTDRVIGHPLFQRMYHRDTHNPSHD